MNDYIFDTEYITNIKKNIINFISRTNINTNKITFNLSLYKDFIIKESKDLEVIVKLPKIINGKITNAKVFISSEYFNIANNISYIKPEYEDILTNKITQILVEAASIKVKYENMQPIEIEHIGLIDGVNDGFNYALSTVIAEDINDYVTSSLTDPYFYNKGIVRMLLAICGYKYAINTYFNQDKSFFVSMYSLSVDNNIFNKINKSLTLIEDLITTWLKDEENILVEKLIKAKEVETLHFIINKLYIPLVNSVPFDKRKLVRDEILKGFLGNNYANLKLNDDNKKVYYWASLINNTVPINNKITDQAWAYYREQVRKENYDNMHDVYATYIKNNSKNNVKEFWVLEEANHTYIHTNKKDIKEEKLVLEMLSYAYISSIDDEFKEKIENGIIRLCQSNKVFTSPLNDNPLSNKMLIAAIIKLASKNNYHIKLLGTSGNVAKFIVN